MNRYVVVHREPPPSATDESITTRDVAAVDAAAVRAILALPGIGTAWIIRMVALLSLVVAATMARQLRSSLSDVMLSSYVRTAWAKGAPLSRVVGKHALKNAAIPPVTILGFLIAGLLGGSVIIESLFSIPGVGSYILDAARAKDLPVIQGATILFVLVYMTISLLIDIAYGLLNPKIRVS